MQIARQDLHLEVSSSSSATSKATITIRQLLDDLKKEDPPGKNSFLKNTRGRVNKIEAAATSY